MTMIEAAGGVICAVGGFRKKGAPSERVRFTSQQESSCKTLSTGKK